MSKIQLKPYLDVRRVGSRLHIGHMPPRGIEIEDAAPALDDLLGALTRPVEPLAVISDLAARSDLPEAHWASLIEQLTEAGVVGDVVPDGGRYARHWLYYDLIGINPEQAQARLRDSVVAVVGSGGIGSNVATLLATAGVGRLILTDGDRIELSNLTRQFLYDESCIGELKVDAAARRLRLLNSSIRVDTIPTPAHQALFLEQLSGCDAVVVSADSPDELHEWVDEGARVHGYGYLAAGYIEAHGSVGPLVLPGTPACFTCMRTQGELASTAPDGEAVSQNLNTGLQAASFGPLNLSVASTAANEVLRLLVGARCETAGRRLLIDSQTYGLTTEDFTRSRDCQSCSDQAPRQLHEWAMDTTSLEDIYDEARATNSINAAVLDDFLHRLADVQPSERVLDYGCGSGEQAVRLADDSGVVVAYDPSPAMLDILSRRNRDAKRTLSSTCEIEKAASSGPYDLIMCTNVLDHVNSAEIASVLSWLRDQLATSGRLILTIPHPIKDGARWLRSGSPDGWTYREMLLGSYFEEGPITKHRETADGMPALRAITTTHRTLATYCALLTDAGLRIETIHEPQPADDVRSTFPEIWAKTSRVPYFLTFVLRSSDQPSGGSVATRIGREDR